MNNILFYKDRPVFGLDIGFSSLKVMQIETNGKQKVVSGYGVTTFDPKALKDGVIIEPEILAKSVQELFARGLIGDITTRRVALAVPAARTFARTMILPSLKEKELVEAIQLETEQYVPVPIDELYVDYEIITKNDQEQEVLAVAVPKKIINSYLQLASLLGLEVVAIETTINSASRLFVQSEQSDLPAVLIDLGSLSSDITIFDKGIVVTGTVLGGGDSFTSTIADALGVSRQEAHVIKTKYGLGVSKKQKEITTSLDQILQQMIKEIRKMIRYYEERSATQGKIGQIVTMGGGANMPGLSEHMTNLLRLPVRMCDPWQRINFVGMEPPHAIERSMYVTVSGLALMNPKEVFHD